MLKPRPNLSSMSPQELADYIKALGLFIGEQLNPDGDQVLGFVLFVLPFEPTLTGPSGERGRAASYVSNVRREDVIGMLAAMQAFISPELDSVSTNGKPN